MAPSECNRGIGRYFTIAGVILLLQLVMFTGAEAELMLAGQSSNSITLTWTAPGDDGATGTATVYDLRYSTSPINGSNWASATQVSGEPTPQAAGATETFTVTSLSESTTYYFAIMSSDEVPNWSGLSNFVSGSTSAEATAPAAIADLSIVSASDTSVTISWTAVGDDGTTGTAAQYDIRYSTAAINESNWNSATQVSGEPSPQAAGDTETVEVKGLSQEVTYYFAIKVADEVPNWSALSNVVNTTTPDMTAPTAISDRAVEP